MEGGSRRTLLEARGHAIRRVSRFSYAFHHKRDDGKPCEKPSDRESGRGTRLLCAGLGSMDEKDGQI